MYPPYPHWLLCCCHHHRCPKLEVVELARNRLINVDVSHLRATLQRLVLNHNPLISMHDSTWEGYVVLEDFEASHCVLEFISFASCPRLTVVHVPHNMLVQFNILDCPNITCIDCSFNHIMELELHTTPRLLSLKCPGNRLVLLTTPPTLTVADAQHNCIAHDLPAIFDGQLMRTTCPRWHTSCM